jgi:hypothetical protein
MGAHAKATLVVVTLAAVIGNSACSGKTAGQGPGGTSGTPGATGSADAGFGSGSGSASGVSASGSPEAGSPSDGGASSTGASTGAVPLPDHRPVALACAPSPGPDAGPVTADGGMTCRTNADCESDSGGGSAKWCLGGTCSVDQCLSDDDCAAGYVCGCSSGTAPVSYTSNTCVRTFCRVDSDCSSGLCSPTYVGYPSDTGRGNYGAFSGYACHSPPGGDCLTGITCPCAGGTSGSSGSGFCGSDTAAQACLYVPANWDLFACQQGSWQCENWMFYYSQFYNSRLSSAPHDGGCRDGG